MRIFGVWLCCSIFKNISEILRGNRITKLNNRQWFSAYTVIYVYVVITLSRLDMNNEENGIFPVPVRPWGFDPARYRFDCPVPRHSAHSPHPYFLMITRFPSTFRVNWIPTCIHWMATIIPYDLAPQIILGTNVAKWNYFKPFYSGIKQCRELDSGKWWRWHVFIIIRKRARPWRYSNRKRKAH